MPVVDPAQNAASTEFLRTSLIDYCLSHGLVVRPQPTLVENPHSCLVTHAPVALYPTEFPRAAFIRAKSIQKDYNELYVRIAMDDKFLAEIMEELKDVDEFMKNLWELYLGIKDSVQGLTLGLFRSDYLLHSKVDSGSNVKQVEFNTISASFGALATRAAEAHRAMVSLGAYQSRISLENLPINTALQGLAMGLATAHKAYVSDCPDAKGVVFVVQKGERNAFDQKWLEYELLEVHGIPSWRVAFTEVQQHLSLQENTNKLMFRSNESGDPSEISTVYYRAGYGPEDYVSEQEWESRRMLELSAAVKCPSIITQLAGSKKVQQVLSQPGVVERFLVHDAAREVRSTFVGMHSLDDSEQGKAAIKLAFDQPERYVLKPQREGGGHNIYRSAIPDFLRGIPRTHWTGYILMELIEPPEVYNAIVRAGEIFPASVVSELGIYGTVLWNTHSKKILHNAESGHLLRTKSKDTDEGGVAAGFACIDSPNLE